MEHSFKNLAKTPFMWAADLLLDAVPWLRLAKGTPGESLVN